MMATFTFSEQAASAPLFRATNELFVLLEHVRLNAPIVSIGIEAKAYCARGGVEVCVFSVVKLNVKNVVSPEDNLRSLSQ